MWKPPQSLSGYIRQHLRELEERLNFGVRQEVILAELKAKGYKTTLKGFRNLLYRARIRAAQNPEEFQTKVEKKNEKEDAQSLAKKSENKKEEVSKNPLKKKAGFDFKGTNSFDESDLI
ncbi:hypothetical protein RAC83_002179 [Xylella fastidiosa]|uniref:P32 n=1 Tax=Xylella fastidiosa TaxID=2371 RepID=D5LLC9_XYLFS|nr:hypothetical protein [Xylella fastidiosa]ADF29419.1 P32 [Xylella fastidiosa]ADF29452.1 P32 [Xylella fastidiosa]ADF29482.1 P32 [Xylella fastidiosa]ADF29512.1 P32 [Xylella fastidiosa]MDS9990836.1 hypothetical protein [Xylella fastidiosa]